MGPNLDSGRDQNSGKRLGMEIAIAMGIQNLSLIQT
jgi:hypothetical protein